MIGFYNQDEKCLQRGTDWVFKGLILHLQEFSLIYQQHQMKDPNVGIIT